jgi:hypothetical protein
MKNSKGN